MTYTVTCMLTACTPGSAPGPTLGIEYGKPLPFYYYTKTESSRVRWQESRKFVEMALTELGVHGVNVVALSRPRRDVGQLNNLGGCLMSSVDPRVSVSVPKNAFRLTTEITLQVRALSVYLWSPWNMADHYIFLPCGFFFLFFLA